MVGSRVYVGGLPFGVRERDLEKFFKGFGRTRDILIKNGYGFVEFEDCRDADDAVYELNGKELLGERVVVEPARGIDRGDRYRRDRGGGGSVGGGAADRYSRDRGRPRYEYGPPTRTEYRLVVENLSSRISWQDLKDYMRQAGEVTYADAHKQQRGEGGRGGSKSSSNTGVVEFATHSDMRAAIEKLDGTELNGRRIKLVEDRRSSRRRSRSSSSRSRSRSRGARRSRSRSRSRRSSRSRSRSKSRPKSKSPAPKSRTRSRSKSAVKPVRSGSARSRSRSGSPVRRAASKPISRSKSPRKSDTRVRSGSPRSRSRSRSPVRRAASKPISRSKSPRKSDSRERSRSRTKDGSPKQEPPRKSVSRSRSRSAHSASRSRSRSGSPRQNGNGEQQRAGSDRSPRSGD